MYLNESSQEANLFSTIKIALTCIDFLIKKCSRPFSDWINPFFLQFLASTKKTWRGWAVSTSTSTTWTNTSTSPSSTPRRSTTLAPAASSTRRWSTRWPRLGTTISKSKEVLGLTRFDNTLHILFLALNLSYLLAWLMALVISLITGEQRSDFKILALKLFFNSIHLKKLFHPLLRKDGTHLIYWIWSDRAELVWSLDPN